MSIDNANPDQWDALRKLNELSIRKPTTSLGASPDSVDQPGHYNTDQTHLSLIHISEPTRP